MLEKIRAKAEIVPIQRGNPVFNGEIRSGKPIQNAFIESFNGCIREECLNVHGFTSLADAQGLIEAWRLDCNRCRPLSGLGYQTPMRCLKDFCDHSTNSN
jgi:transposase InsO family protein